jgi:acyl-CoA reductase-like NAD-dependent aldehyde dehydrogenase
MLLMQEESFGPFIGIMKVRKRRAGHCNDAGYGIPDLQPSVYSNSQEMSRKYSVELNTGTGYWNCCDRVSASVP